MKAWYAVLSVVVAVATLTATSAAVQERGGQEEYGPYDLVANWPQPLPDGTDGVKHDGWTWGSEGAVFAETPDRIWIAQRGELPLPAGAQPWTPYGMLEPPRIATGSDDGLTDKCAPAPRRGWERRYHHVIFVVDRTGAFVQGWPQHDTLFDVRCGRGPHKIKMDPYDPEKHVWVIDDQVHVIYKFTYDGMLVMTLGTKGQHGRDGGRLFDRPTDIAWLPARSSSPTGTSGLASRNSTGTARSSPTGAPRRRIRPTRVPTSSTPSTASPSARTVACSSWIAAIGASRCSTRTASSSTCGRLAFDRPPTRT
jgi:hypothetical protein